MEEQATAARTRAQRRCSGMRFSANLGDRSHQIRGVALPARRELGRARRAIFRCSRKAPNWSSSACSMRRARTRQRIRIRERTNGAWHIYLPGVGPGPAVRLSRARTLRSARRGCASIRTSCCSIPMPRRSAANCKWADELFGYQLGDPDGDLSFDDRDSAPFAPLGAVIDPSFDWSGEQRPSHPAHETLIYEAHVRGMTDAASGGARTAARHLCGHGVRTHHQAPAARSASPRSS